MMLTDPGIDEVNTSSTGVGVNAQNISVNLTLRLDYVTNVNLSDGTGGSGTGDSKDITLLTFDDHYVVNDASFTIIQTGGNASNRVDAWVQVFDSTDTAAVGPFDPFDLLDDPTDIITRVVVVDEFGTVLEDTDNLGMFNDANIVVNFDPFGVGGDVLVEGLLESYQVFVSTADGFSRMEITNLTTGSALGFGDIDFTDLDNIFVQNPVSNDTFDLGGFELQTLQSGDPVEFSFDVTPEDADGDQSSGVIDVTLLPQIAGTLGADVLIGNGDSEILLGFAGNDILDGGGGEDFLIGGLGSDNLTGGPGADTFIFSLASNAGADTITDFDRTADILRFEDVVDVEPNGLLNLTDLNATISGVADAGAGNDVTVSFFNGASIVFQTAGTGSINSIDDLVDDPITQLMIV